MRGDPYVFESKFGMNIMCNGGSITMPIDKFNALAVMVIARMDDEQKAEAIKNALAHRGNFGCDALAESMGLETAMDMIKKEFPSGILMEETKEEVIPRHKCSMPSCKREAAISMYCSVHSDGNRSLGSI